MTEQERLERRLTGVYKEAQKDLQKKLNDYIEKFRAEDARKKKELEEEAITQEEYDDWRQGAIFRGKMWRARVKQMTDSLADANNQSLRMVRGDQLKAFADGMNHEQYVLEQNTGLSVNFGIYDADTVARLVRDQPELLPKKKLNRGKDQAWNQKKITNAVTQGIIQGESIDDIAKRIARDTARQNSDAMIRYARTATTGAQNAGRMETMHRAKGMGINVRKQWLATLDARTRNSHQQMDGVTVDADEDFITPLGSKMQYPGDPAGKGGDVWNCRCTVVYDYPDFPGDPGERLDNVTGEHVRGDMTYAEWIAGKTGDSSASSLQQKIEQAAKGTAKKADFAQEMKELIESCKDDLSVENLQKIGKRMSEEIESRSKTAEKIDYSDELQKLYKEERELGSAVFDKELEYQYARMRRDPKADELEKEYLELKKKREELSRKYDELRKKQQDQESFAMRDVLSQIRPLGGVTKENMKEFMSLSKGGKTADATIDAMNFYPASWLRKSADFGIKLKPKWTSGRAYYSPYDGEIRVDERRSTCIHELGHRMEQVLEGLRKIEQDYYAHRTAGEELQWLGPGYARTERTRKDNFLSPYMGKDYGGQAFELVSMGFQYVYTDYETLSKDEDMKNWILGILAAL